MKGKSAEGERCLKRSAWAYVEEAYDCHRLDGVLRSLRGIVNGIFHSENAVFGIGNAHRMTRRFAMRKKPRN